MTFNNHFRSYAVALLLFLGTLTFPVPPVSAASSTLPQPSSIESSNSAPLSTKQIYRQLLDGTVWVWRGNTSHGTGWIIDKKQGLIITNHHVVRGAEQVKIYPPKFNEGDLVTDSEEYTRYSRPIIAKVLDSDVGKDLAVLQVLTPLPKRAKELPLAEKSATAADRVHLCGGKPESSQGVFVYANGHVRQVSKGINAAKAKIWIIQTTVPANRGNSGGAIVNDEGKVVGVHSMSWRQSNVVTGGTDLRELKTFMSEVKVLYPPKTADDHFKVGCRHYVAGRLGAATTYLSQAIQIDAKKGNAYRLRGYCFYKNKDNETAKKDFDRAIALDKGDWSAYQGRALTSLSAGRLDDAVNDINQAITLNPTSKYAYHDRGSIQVKRQKFEEAVKDFNRAINLDKNYHDAIMKRGVTFLNLGLPEKALADFNIAAKLNPTATAYNNIGIAFRNLGQQEQSVQSYAQATKINPNYYLPWENLGEAYVARQNYDAAISYLDYALRLNPKTARGFEIRGRAKFLAGKQKEALADLQASLKLDSRRASSYATRSAMYAQLGYPEQAEKDFQVANKLDPKRFPQKNKQLYTSTKSSLDHQPKNLTSGQFNGKWRYQNCINGVRYDCTVVFDGPRFSYIISWVDAAGRPGKIQKHGTFTIGQNFLRLQSNGGTYADHEFAIRNGRLFIDFPNANEFFGFTKVS